jgi:hypothetical protein
MMTKTKSVRHIIDTRLAGLQLNDDLASRVVSSGQPRGTKKPLVVAAALGLCLILAVPVMAATLPGFNRLLSLLSPEMAQILQPVALVSESTGIKMEVLAAMNDDDTAVAYLTMQDLTGDRIKGSIDLYNYSISAGHMFTHEMIAYDEPSKTATIRLLANGGSQLNGQKITLRIDSFLSDKQVFKEVATGVDPANISQAPLTIPLDMNDIRGGGGELFQQLRAQGTVQVLPPEVLNAPLPGIDFAHLSNVGIVEGRLHVQIKWTGNGVDDHGYVYLEDGAGRSIYPSNFSFGRDASGNAGYGREYEEFILDVDPDQLAQYKLKGYFVANRGYVEGKWQTTFKIEAIKASRQVDCRIETGHMTITRVAVSPLGLTLRGSGPAQESEALDVSVAMLDGRVLEFDHTTSFNDGQTIIKKYMPALPLDVEKVSQASINGQIVKFDH